MPDTYTDNLRLVLMENGTHDNTWNDVYGQNYDKIDAKLGDVTAIVTTGGTTTLSESEERVNAINLSGTLASNATIAFSGRGGTWIVKNACSGGYTVTLKKTGQTGVVINAGEVAIVYYNGSDIAKATSATEIGIIVDWPAASAPAGWLYCYGQDVSRTTYAALFAVIGVTYGTGNGVTTFGLPDCRDRFRLGKGDMGGSEAGRILGDLLGSIDTLTLGAVGGEEGHAQTIDEMAVHAHGNATGNAGGHTHQVNIGLSVDVAGGAGAPVHSSNQNANTTTDNPGNHSHSIAEDGGGEEHNNIPPAIVFNTMIYAGVAA